MQDRKALGLTSVAAEMQMFMDEDKVGALQAGRYADIIGVDGCNKGGNPLDDLSLLEFEKSSLRDEGWKVIDLDK